MTLSGSYFDSRIKQLRTSLVSYVKFHLSTLDNQFEKHSQRHVLLWLSRVFIQYYYVLQTYLLFENIIFQICGFQYYIPVVNTDYLVVGIKNNLSSAVVPKKDKIDIARANQKSLFT